MAGPGMHAEDFRIRLLAGDLSGGEGDRADPTLFPNRPPGPPDEAAVAFVRPMVEKASLALCINEAWAMLAWSDRRLAAGAVRAGPAGSQR